MEFDGKILRNYQLTIPKVTKDLMNLHVGDYVHVKITIIGQDSHVNFTEKSTTPTTDMSKETNITQVTAETSDPPKLWKYAEVTNDKTEKGMHFVSLMDNTCINCGLKKKEIETTGERCLRNRSSETED